MTDVTDRSDAAPVLSLRQARILKLVVGEYVRTAAPVGSDAIARRFEIGVSPATVRNELAVLEQWGYLYHPHTSAGRIPSDLGYRFFVEKLMDSVALSPAEARRIQHQFHQVDVDPEQWSQLAAAVIAQAVRNAALVTLPLARVSRVREVQLVAMHDNRALLIVALQDGRIRQQIVALPAWYSVDELHQIAYSLTIALRGRADGDVDVSRLDEGPTLSVAARTIVEYVQSALRQADAQTYANLWLDGVGFMVRQPEFADPTRLRAVIEVLEDRAGLVSLIADAIADDGVRVYIGEENPAPGLRHCAIVLARYGQQEVGGGVLAIVGPTRLEYARAISAVRYVAHILSDLHANAWR